MYKFPTIRRRAVTRASVLLSLFVVGVLCLGARCIERTHTYVDADGYTHITGQMANDTDVQATKMMLQGTLFDANGNVVAQKTSPTCPPDSQPHSEIAFDIRFDNPNLPPWTRFDVRPVSGVTLTSPLPSSNVALLLSEAGRFPNLPPIPGLGITDKDVVLIIRARNQGTAPLVGVQGCAAVYDQSGNVTYVQSDEIVEQDANGNVGTATLPTTEPEDVFMVAKNVPVGPVQIRAWLWFGKKGDSTSAYQWVSTGLIAIQTIN